ncbi:alpha/beta hydrolase [Planctomicrobium sp. SH527]|uniref:alpha/beta hydrolase n=1 Tax=Planctomicrobium sp. SH527 TaxID=3448123 RepID=UPI003F5BAD27
MQAVDHASPPRTSTGSSRLGKWALCLGGLLVVNSFTAPLVISAVEQTIVFPAPAVPTLPPTLDANAEFVKLDTPGGQIEVILLRPTNQSSSVNAPLMVYCHGNKKAIDLVVDQFDDFRNNGVAILLAEYPGYGRSVGVASEKAIQQSQVAAYDWAIQQPGIDANRVIGYGRALGGGAICALARERQFNAVVLESTFSSITSAAKARFGPFSYFVTNTFNNLEVVPNLNVPILILHGDRDELLPFFHAEQLHDANPSSELISLSGGHTDCVEVFPKAMDFLRRHNFCTTVVAQVESESKVN